MNSPENTHRRTVLKTLGAAAVGGTVLTGTAAADSDLVSKIDSSGHYAYFPLEAPDSWARQEDPFNIYSFVWEDAPQEHPLDNLQKACHWMTMPHDDDSVRCLLTNLPANRNAGFDVHVGRLGDIQEVTIDAETVRTNQSGDAAVLFVGLYLDADDNGDFFAWNDGRENTERWDGFGGDSEGAIFPTADGEIAIDGDTGFQLFHVGGDTDSATLDQLQAGEVDGVDGETIDGDTDAAFYVGVASAGEGTEEVIINSLTVERA